jgi:hypothetical protein
MFPFQCSVPPRHSRPSFSFFGPRAVLVSSYLCVSLDYVFLLFRPLLETSLLISVFVTRCVVIFASRRFLVERRVEGFFRTRYPTCSKTLFKFSALTLLHCLHSIPDPICCPPLGCGLHWLFYFSY